MASAGTSSISGPSVGGSLAWGGATSFSDVTPDYGLLPATVRDALVGKIDGHLLNGALGGCIGFGSCSFEATFTNEVPLPAAAWLFGSALLGLGAIKRKRS